MRVPGGKALWEQLERSKYPDLSPALAGLAESVPFGRKSGGMLGLAWGIHGAFRTEDTEVEENQRSWEFIGSLIRNFKCDYHYAHWQACHGVMGGDAHQAQIYRDPRW